MYNTYNLPMYRERFLNVFSSTHSFPFYFLLPSLPLPFSSVFRGFVIRFYLEAQKCPVAFIVMILQSVSGFSCCQPNPITINPLFSFSLDGFSRC